eukprot:8977708-Alexandrium_andersonii.AAC.1
MSARGTTQVDLRRRAEYRPGKRRARFWLSWRASRPAAARCRRTTALAAEASRAAVRAATAATAPAREALGEARATGKAG